MLTPNWLLRDEAYAPRPDKDAFIDKGIRSFLSLLSVLRRRAGGGSEQGRIDARVGLACTFLLVLLVSLSQSMLFLACTATLVLVAVSLQRGQIIRDVMKSSVAAGLFTLAIMLPSAIWGNAAGASRLTIKVLVCVAAVRLFSAATEWRRVTRALASFRVPDIFILVLDITLRSLALLGELSLGLLYALRLRSVGRNPTKTRALSGIAGTLFLRSQQMTEDMHSAMECRGFTGDYRTARAPGLRLIDIVPVLIGAGLIGAFFLTSV